MSRNRTPAKRCQHEIEVWGPHPGCREFMSELEFAHRCHAPATHVVKQDNDPTLIAPTYPPRRRARPQ